MDMSMERKAILSVYNSETWKYKVLHKFSESQVIAVYLSFRKRGLVR